MRKEGRGKERTTTTHLIKIHVFTHASHVLLNLARTTFVPIRNGRGSWVCTILLLAADLQDHLDHWLKQSRKHLATFTSNVWL